MVDKVELAKKYAEEREKRVRADGLGQYRTVDLDSGFGADPFVKERSTRAAVHREHEVVIIGGGWSGILTAVQMRKQGLDDLCILDRAADFGGTWYWNRYPGIACDCESYLYLPMLEEMGYMPSTRYTPGDEIRDYARSVAEHFELDQRTLFETAVTTAEWNESATRWHIITDRGDEITARFLVIGTGILNRPKLPGIPGLESYEGRSFHSSRWDYEYTGGTPRGGLEKLKDKRVAIIGTGPTGLQAIPHLANSGAELYVFQRTPVIVAERGNGPTDPDWYHSQEPGWQERRIVNFESQMFGIPIKERIVTDAWTVLWGIPTLKIPTDGTPPDFAGYKRELEEFDIEQMELIRQRVDEQVLDPDVAAALKPWYATHCKRPSFHDEYLQSYNLPNVHLVDTQGRGPDRITPTGVVFDGTEYAVDLIVYATGYESIVSCDRAGNFDVIGTDGRTLADEWQKRVRTVHGIFAHGFPNMYVVGGIRQGGNTVNAVYTSEKQAIHVARNLRLLLDAGVIRHDVTAEAVQEWCDEMDRLLFLTFDAEATRSCTPGYFNNEGVYDVTGEQDHGRPLYADVYGAGAFAYYGVLSKWNDKAQYLEKSDLTIGSPSRSR